MRVAGRGNPRSRLRITLIGTCTLRGVWRPDGNLARGTFTSARSRGSSSKGSRNYVPRRTHGGCHRPRRRFPVLLPRPLRAQRGSATRNPASGAVVRPAVQVTGDPLLDHHGGRRAADRRPALALPAHHRRRHLSGQRVRGHHHGPVGGRHRHRRRGGRAVEPLLVGSDRGGADLQPPSGGFRPCPATVHRVLHPCPNRCPRQSTEHRCHRCPTGVHVDAERSGRQPHHGGRRTRDHVLAVVADHPAGAHPGADLLVAGALYGASPAGPHP